MMGTRIGQAIGAAALIAMVVAPGGSVAAPPRAAPLAALRSAIDSVAGEAVRTRATAGMVVGVSRNGVPVLVRGYGLANLEDGTPVRADTVFRVGSVTKQFTAACILLLAERGQLSLDDPLAKYVPGFPRGGEVTIRQLLTHTSGIHNYTAIPDFLTATARDELPTPKMVELIARIDPLYDFPPGTSFAYSNSGYLLLGAIIERVSGQSYAGFLKANVLGPLGLAHTAVDDLDEIVPGRASGYEKAKGAGPGFTNAAYISMSAASAAGAIRSTAGDLLRWHAALLGGKLLKPASVALMIAPGRLRDGRLASSSVKHKAGDTDPPVDYGFGLATTMRHGHREIEHGGSINGFNAAIATFPADGIAVVILTNTGGSLQAIAPKMYDAILGAPLP